MKLIKVAGAVLNQTPLAWDSNKQHILKAIELAKKDGVSILCLPELCITGYGCEDAFHSPALIEMSWKILKEILPATEGLLVSIGLPILHQNGIFNTACFISDQKILGFVAKRYLAGDGIHYEPRWFKPWPHGLKAEIKVDNESYPLGDLLFDVSGIKIGFEICEDAWVARRPGGDLSLKGVDIILNPSASHFAFGKYEVRKRFVTEGSRAFGVSYIYANLMGCESGRAIYDGGVLIASGGKLMAEGKRFSFEDVLITSTTVDISMTRMNQSRTASFQPSLKDGASVCVQGNFDFPSSEPGVALDDSVEAWERSNDLKKEEFTRAVTLGLFDYLRKTRSQGFVVSLSGGADSSAVACLVALMVEFGVHELSLSKLFGKISHVKKLSSTKSAKEIIRSILACVYQSTENSSDTTRTAAKQLSDAVGAEFFIFDVNLFVRDYVDMVSKSIQRKMSWETDDISLQNIQARVRAPGVWLLANERQALLLTTSNRSEAAVGYATMDGDTCGGLSPIGGIDKAFLREWLRWIEVEGPKGLHPIPVLSLVNKQEPTAELRPLGNNQTDEKDLMPYEILDAVERCAIRDRKSPLEIFLTIRNEYKDLYTDNELYIWIERFFNLWCRNQWKRERYAPSFHLDDESLDPKTWCRFPILSGNYEREFNDLKDYLLTTSRKPIKKI